MLKFAKFIGANTDFSTAQAFLFPRILTENPEEPVFGLVISGEGDDIFVYVRQKILNLEEKFSSPFERVTEKLHELGEIFKTEFLKVGNLQFTLFCAKDSTFYVYQSGKNYVQMWRDGASSAVFQDDALQEKVISGFIKAGDKILILSAKPSERNWSEDVVEQVLTLPSSEVDDAESIFAQDELKLEQKEDFAGVRNIEPVAFILLENVLPDEDQIPKEDGEARKMPGNIPMPKINLKLTNFAGAMKLPGFNPWLFFHKLSRRFFGLFRRMNRKLLAVLGILILISALAGGGYLFWKSRHNNRNLRFDNLVTSVEASLNEAGGLKDSDPKQAAEKISQAKARLAEAEGLDKENSKIKELKGRIDEKETEVLKIYKNFELELFMSLDLIKDTFKTEKMSFSVSKILLLDPTDKSLVSIDTELKTPSILAGPQQLGNAQIATLNGSHAFVYAPNKGVTHVDIDTKKVTSVATVDPEWGSVTDIFGFAGNAYILDTNKNKIWKYAPTEGGYSDRQEYLRSEANLGLGKKLVIDYSVWVLTSEPDIKKFTAGSSDFYAMSGLNDPLSQIDNLFIPEDLDSVFILDKSTNRILVTKKNGEYLAQYINPEFSKVSDFFVDETLKQIYLLIENKIYRTPLR